MAEPLPARVPLELYRGDTRIWSVAFGVDGVPMPLTGHTVSSQIRADPDSEDPPMAVIITEVDEPESGSVRLTLTHAESAKLVVGRAYWDLQFTRLADGYVRTYLAGNVKVKGDVSRP